MRCSGLTENMDLEEAIVIICNTENLWKCILTVQGKKKDDILNDKLCIKARNTLIEMKRASENGTMSVKLLKKINERKDICQDLFSLVLGDKCKTMKKKWIESLRKINQLSENVKMAISVIKIALHKACVDIQERESVLFCLKLLEEQCQRLNEGNISIKDSRFGFSCENLFDKICEECIILSKVVESDVFWNLTLQFPNVYIKTDVKEDQDNEYLGIALLFEENEPETEFDITVKNLHICCNYLKYLSDFVLKEYHKFWSTVLYGNDVSVSLLQRNLQNAEVMQELKLAETICHHRADKSVRNYLEMYSELENQSEKVNLIKKVLTAFKIDLMEDEHFPKALCEYERLLNGDIENMTLSDIGQSLTIVGRVVNVVDKDMLAVLEELQKASILIEFLQTVVDEDIRNLIDAVEEHSEQFVRESTVSDLIEVKRLLQPILKQKYADIKGFFNTLNKSLETSGIKRAEQKIYECSSNLHSLKALYNHVANRGEHTKEIIEKIVKKGTFHFCLGDNECDVTVEYTQDRKTHAYSKSYLNDLRSRALLILNTEEKQSKPAQPFSIKKEHLFPFTQMIDSSLEIGHMYVLLKEAGHFRYVQFEQKTSRDNLSDLLNELKSKYEDWCKVLSECRKKFYLMNFIHSDQLHLLFTFTKKGQNQDAVITLLKFINPGLSDFNSILYDLQQCIDYENPEQNLEALGETLERIGKHMVLTTETMFDRKPKSKLSDKVQAGKLYIAALDPDSELVIKTLLALHWHTTQTIPFAHNVLFCNRNTSQDELTLLLNRCLGCKTDGLFTIANIEMLSHDTQDFLVEALCNFQENPSFKLSLLFKGNQHHPFLEKLGDLVIKPKPLSENELQQFLSKKYPNVLIITSEVPGLGKTEEIQKLALRNNMGKKTLHISGLFDREKIVHELLRMNIKPYHILHIDIGKINKPQELETFLFELIVLKHVNARKCAYHLQTDHICVEIANTVSHELSNSLLTVACFRRKHIKWEDYNNMIVSQEVNSSVQVVCHYLQLYDSGKLDQTDLYLTGIKKVVPLPKDVCRKLLQKHFSTSCDMSFTVLNIFLGVFADQLKKLSSSVFFRASNIQHQSVKRELVTALKNMSTEFSSRSINACRIGQIASMNVLNPNQKEDATNTCAEVLAKRTEGMIRWEDSNHLVVLFHSDLHTVSALYRNKEHVPKQILDLFESQLKKMLDNFSEKSQEELKSVLLKLVQPPDVSALNEVAKQYALAPDNLLKMVLIILRIQGRQPVIIMGETGCGKTSLIRFLSVVCQIDFDILSIHAGVTEEVIARTVLACDDKAKENLRKSFWLFLDEINTCDHLGLICDIICHHLCNGKQLAPNLKILAACNPYRLRSDESIFTTGLQGKIKTDQLSKLVYRVHPLPETMIDYVWDYGTLQEKDEKTYIERMIQGLFKNEKLVQLFVQLLIISQRFVREMEGTDCCVSLRDVERCRKLVKWFEDMLKNKDKTQYYLTNELETTSMILALSICYHSRFPDNKIRKCYREKIAKCGLLSYALNDEGKIERVIVKQQNDILARMELPPGTAKNTALRENVFVVLVCILNRIPVFVVGKPGCSKSLSMQLIRSNLRGKDSSDDFFRSLPQLYCVSFQGSESSTSDGIIKVFEKAKNYQNHNQSEDVLSVVILDEIGLAEISRFNPLKVLHNLLEPENQVFPDIAVVGISNWALDAAKMNRAIHLSRPEMDEKELYETALSITESLLKQSSSSEAAKLSIKKREVANKITEEAKHLLQKLAKSFSMYNKKQKYKSFHGLRDFYSLTKFIGKEILVDKQIQEIDEVIIRGLLRNLGGLSKELRNSMLQEFQHCLQANHKIDIGVLDLIRDNLSDKQNRHLMLITNGDAVLSVLEDTMKDMQRQHVVIFGSRFEDDLTDDYNYRVLSRIILCMEQGYVLILKDLENIYGSLYDMLNQNYTTVGSKKNCRVALGPYSNPMCHVHDDFKCIVLVEETKLDFSDPPFLNRFEKQQFRFEDMMDENSINIRNGLIQFTADFCKIDGHSYNPESVFALSGENVVSSLVLSIKKDEHDEKQIIQKCQEKLLWITTPEAMVRIKESNFGKAKPNSVFKLEKLYFDLPVHNGLFDLLEFFNSNEKNENKLTNFSNGTSLVAVFTYDIHDQALYNQPINIKTERLRNFKSEKHLNQTIRNFFESDSKQLLLHCNVAEDLEHIFLAKCTIENGQKYSLKNMSESKNVCIICHLDKQEHKHEQVTQINFLSGWKLAYLDTLCEPKTPLPRLINLSVVEILESRRPMTNIVRDNIFWGFTTIQYVGTGHTVEKMMDIVCNIKNSEDCLNVLEELVFSNIRGSENKTFEGWQRNVACNDHALVKASCYINALEQYLLDLIKNPLSKIIFKLEEANALNSVFRKDSEQERRFTVWKQLIEKDSLIDIANIPDPSGPECYTCSSERYSMRLPFSYLVLCRVEKVKDDFLNTIRQLKISCDMTEDEDVPAAMLSELVEKYSEVIEQDITEYLEIDYPEKFSEYKHDFNFMMSSRHKGNLNEEERILVMNLAQTLIDIEEPAIDFARQVTYIHVLHWIYCSAMDSVLVVMNIVKEYTNISIDSLFLDIESPENVSTSVLDSEDRKRNMLVDRLCKIFLPTTSLMKRFSSVQEWQYQISRLLPCFAEISLDPSSIHELRFCNDVAHAMFSTQQEEAIKILSTFGDELKNGACLESNEMFKHVTTQFNVALEKKMLDFATTQQLVCQYLSRSINIVPELNSSLVFYLKSTKDESICGKSLHLFGPILKVVIEIENDDESLIKLVDFQEIKEEGYMRCINECLKTAKGDTDSNLSSLLVVILQEVYHKRVTPETLNDIQESSDDICTLAIRASNILREQRECSLNLVASIAYLRSLLDNYVQLLRQNNMNGNSVPIVTQTINAIMEPSDEENSPANLRTRCLQVFFLKCIFSDFEIDEIKRFLNDLKNSLTVFKSLEWKQDFLSISLTFHPLLLYTSDNEKNWETELQQLENLEKKKILEYVDITKSDSQTMFSFIGCLTSIYYLKSQQREKSNTSKDVSKYIFERIQEHFSTTQCRVIEMLLNLKDFNHTLLLINTGTKAPDIQIVSVLIHLLSLVIFKGKTGNLYYDILMDVSIIKTRYLPGNVSKKSAQCGKSKLQLCENCKIRFINTTHKCPKCDETCKIHLSCENCDETLRNVGYGEASEELLVSGLLSPVVHHLLQFITHGCVLLAIAVNFKNSDKIKTLLCLKDDPNDVLQNILLLKWKHLQSLTQLNNENLCALMHILIHDVRSVFQTGGDPFNCKTVENCEKVEKKFQSCIEHCIKEKYVLIKKARSVLYKRLGVNPSSLERQIYEVCVMEESEEKRQMLPRLFRMTSLSCKNGLVAQVFLDNSSETFPFLSLVLMEEEILALPKYILPILRWHRSTVSIGSYKMKKVDCKEETIEKFFKMESDDKRRRLLKQRFEEFKTSWNDLIRKQSHLLKTTLNEENFLSDNSKVIKCIITDEQSVIQKVFLELVKIHNYFIDFCLHLASKRNVPSLRFLMTGKQMSHVKSTSLWELTKNDIINFHSWDDKLLEFSQCHLNFSEGQDRFYDLTKIENELTHNLILGKPYISVPQTFPRILFVDELFQNTVQLLENIRKNILQEKLPQQIGKYFAEKKESNCSIIPEVMTVLGMSLSLLKKTKGEHDLPLIEYLEGWKDLAVFPKHYKRLFPEPEDAVKLCHVVNLYMKLEELNGEIIHETLDFKYRDELPPEGKKLLQTIGKSHIGHLEMLAGSLKIFFHRSLSVSDNTVSVNKKLHECINDEEFWPQESLKDGIVSVGGKMKNLNEIICNSLCVKHTYKTISFIQDFVQVS